MSSRTVKEAAVLREVELLWQALEEEKRIVQQKQIENEALGMDVSKRDAALAVAQQEIDYLTQILREADAKRKDDIDQYAALLLERDATLQGMRSELERAKAHSQHLAVSLNNAEAELARDRSRREAAEAEARIMSGIIKLQRDAADERLRDVLGMERAERDMYVEGEAVARSGLANAWRLLLELDFAARASAGSARFTLDSALGDLKSTQRVSERCIAASSKMSADAATGAHEIVQEFYRDMLSIVSTARGIVLHHNRLEGAAERKRQLLWSHVTSWFSAFASSMTNCFLDLTEIALKDLCTTFLQQRASAENVFKQLSLFKQKQQQTLGLAVVRRDTLSDDPSDELHQGAVMATDVALQARLVALQDRFLQSQRMLQFSNRRVEDLEVKLDELERERKSSQLLQPLSVAALRPAADINDDGGRSNAVSVLRQQLDGQAHVLQLLEASEREAATARSSSALSSALVSTFSRLIDEALVTHGADLSRFTNEFELERMQLRSTLESAAEQHRVMAEQQERLMRLLGSDGLAVASDVRDDLKFRTKFLDVLCDTEAPFSSTILADFLFDFKAELASVLYLETMNVLSNAFVSLAPRVKTSTHLRVHVLEGALSLAEAQREQCNMVANWLSGECEHATRSLEALLVRTNAAINSADDSASSSRRGVGDGAKLLAGQLQMEDARIAGDAQAFRLLCERFLSGVESLHCRLLQTEIALSGVQASSKEREAAAAECMEQMDHARISQFVEREIADDALLCLREHLRLERQVGLQSMRSLTAANEERNVWIRQLQHDVNARALQGRSFHLLAQYVEGAFECTLANLYDMGRECLVYVRAQTTDRVVEVGFTFQVVHFELGQALLLGHEATLHELFRDFDGLLRRVIDEKYALREKLVAAGDHTMQLLQERRLERASAQWLTRHLTDAVALHTVESHAESIDLLAEVTRDLLTFGHKYAASVGERQRDASRLAELELVVASLETVVDEHKMALAASSATSVSVQRVLEDKLAALRAAEERLSRTLAELDDAKMTLKRQEDQIKFLHKKVQSESDALKEARLREEELQQRHNNVSQLQADVLRLEQAVAAEREAHRNTIRSFSNHR